MSYYSLPDLPYDYGALEPVYDGHVLELHHGKHHAAYVTALNKTLERLADARAGADFRTIVCLEKTLAFNLSGHVLHSLFWKNLSPNGGGMPAVSLRAPSTDPSAHSIASSLPRRPSPSRDPDGEHSRGSRSANDWSSSRSTTITGTRASDRCLFW